MLADFPQILIEGTLLLATRHREAAGPGLGPASRFTNVQNVIHVSRFSFHDDCLLPPCFLAVSWVPTHAKNWPGRRHRIDGSESPHLEPRAMLDGSRNFHGGARNSYKEHLLHPFSLQMSCTRRRLQWRIRSGIKTRVTRKALASVARKRSGTPSGRRAPIAI